MNRTQLIQDIINTLKYKSYLEIGCQYDVNFSKIKVPNKVGVDPTSGGTHRMTSDEFFVQNSQMFDIVFIDGLHLSEQVDKDIANSLKFLNPNGTIVLHDCNPDREELQRKYMVVAEWTGDVWKSIVKQRANLSVDCCVGDFDYGCGVIRVRENSDPIKIGDTLTWTNLVINRQQWLRLKSYADILDWIQ